MAASLHANLSSSIRKRHLRLTRRERIERIVVVGSIGSGKTMLAHEISEHLGAPHIELDALHWEQNWVEAPNEVFRKRVADALRRDLWVVDGNYHQVRDIVWSRADTVVWLDYSFPVIMSRLTRRTLQRFATKEELWNGNRERLWVQFFTPDSVFWWAVKTYRSRRREYPALLQKQEYSHLQVLRFKSPRETEKWLATLIRKPGNASDLISPPPPTGAR